MKIDLYTKIILTLIAIFLGIIAVKPLLPSPVSAADGKFGHVQFSSMQFFDSRSGDLWLINLHDSPRPPNWSFDYLGRVEAMGKFRPAGSR